MVLGVDIDGILANFFTAYEDLYIQFTGENKFPARYPEIEPPVWFWPEHYGYSAQDGKVVWDYIKNSPDFWLKLGRLPGAKEFLNNLSDAGHTTYFVTDRPGVQAQKQTTAWLIRAGYLGLPSVILSKNKGAVCRTLGIQVYIDDKVENVESVWNDAPDTQCYLFKYPYNSALHGMRTWYEVDTLVEFAEKVKLWVD